MDCRERPAAGAPPDNTVGASSGDPEMNIAENAPSAATFERRSTMKRIPMKRAWRLGMIGAVVSIAATVGALSYPGLIKAFNPQPDPPGTQRFAPLGVTAN